MQNNTGKNILKKSGRIPWAEQVMGKLLETRLEKQ